MPYDPKTAYDDDYPWWDCVEDATFTPKDPAQDGDTDYATKVVEIGDDVEQLPEGQRVALAPTETSLLFWRAGSSAPLPQSGDVVTYAGNSYTIKRSSFSGQEPLVLVVQPQLVNT